MKKSLNYLFAALMIIIAASCTKESLPENGSASGTKVVKCYFDQTTKTTADGLTPKWVAGDKVQFIAEIKSGAYSWDAYKTVLTLSTTEANGKISEDGRYFEFVVPEEWGFSGEDDYLYAKYPAEPSASVTQQAEYMFIEVPKEQDGTFASANICVAEMDGTESSMSFKNITSILKMTVNPAVTKKIKVSSNGGYSDLGIIGGNFILENINGDMRFSQAGSPVHTIVVNVESEEDLVDVYVSVCRITGNEDVSGFSFSFYRDSEDDEAAYEMTASQTNTLGPNKFYDLGVITYE